MSRLEETDDITSPLIPDSNDEPHHRTPSSSTHLFQPAASIADVVDAIVRGNFKKPEGWLKANPALLIQIGTATTPSGVIIKDVTPLQAAIMACDKKLFESIKEMLLSHHSQMEFEKQRLEIYKRRLRAYMRPLQETINGLSKDDSPEYIAGLRLRRDTYQQALDSQRFEDVFIVLQTADKDNARDLIDDILDAIKRATANEVKIASAKLDASYQKTDRVHADTWTDLALTEKINIFRRCLKKGLLNVETLLQEACVGLLLLNGCIEKQTLYWRCVIESIRSQLPAGIAQALPKDGINMESFQKLHQSFQDAVAAPASKSGVSCVVS